MVNPPIDHGWAWVCVLGCNIVNFFVVGGFKSLGIFLVEFIETFNSNSYLTSWIAGIMSLFMSVLAPFANALGALFTNRLVVMIGGVVMATGAIASVFADSILYIVLVYGIVTGAGFGLSYSPSIVVVGQYFNKRRSLANGIAVAGASIGQFVIPPLLRYLVDTYTIRGALLIYGGLTLHVVLCGALYTPFSFYTNIGQHRDASKKLVQDEKKLPNVDNPQKNLKNDTSDSLSPSKKLIENSQNCEASADNNSVTQTPQESDIQIAHKREKWKSVRYTSTGSLHFASLQNIPDKSDEEDHRTLCCHLKKWEQQKSGVKLFEFSLLKNYLFIIYICGISFGNIGYINPLIILPKHAEDIGISKQNAALLLSIAGICDFFGRVGGGWFSDLNLIRRSRLMSICLALTGTIAILCSFFDTFASMIVYCIVMGAIGGSYISLMAVVLVDFLGIEKLPRAFGITIMFMGSSNLAVPSILGLIRDSLGYHNAAFQICGVSMLIGSLAFSLEPCAKKLEDRKRVKKDQKVSSEQA